ncbi:MAG: aminotransferase class V-fold PLP-dependent enzyme [Verrucomicrobia bacterium]|nr:aminotransferase class V-fold PLP-dependent enzyme [Verrucomicrobiota bacterium]
MSPYKKFWGLDPEITFLNHGSFGACPTAILERQDELRRELERNPMDFLHRTLEPRYDYARQRLADFVGCKFESLTFVPNATTGVNSVLQSLSFKEGDEIIVTNHEYNASRNALNYVAFLNRVRVRQVDIPYPIQKREEVVLPVLKAITPRTRLVLLDHITSATGFIMPIEEIIQECNRRNIETLIDGAHGPGMVPLNLDQLGATYYTGNCHKWMCTPKGSALLYVRPDRISIMHPSVISHGFNTIRTDRSKYSIQFGWTGTICPTPYLCVPDTIDFLEKTVPGGWPAIREYNHQLVLQGRDLLCKALNVPVPCPDEFQGSMVTIPIPADPRKRPPTLPRFEAILQNDLWERHKIEVPIFFWPDLVTRHVRISAQLYNSIEDYQTLADALLEELDREKKN